MLRLVSFFCGVIFFMTAHSHSGRKYEIADADEHYAHHNFLKALQFYKELLKADKANADINYKSGQCY